jgi:hypothetical protein
VHKCAQYPTYIFSDFFWNILDVHVVQTSIIVNNQAENHLNPKKSKIRWKKAQNYTKGFIIGLINIKNIQWNLHEFMVEFES